MSKLPKIYQSDERIISNNKNSYVSYDKKEESKEELDISENIYSLFNKSCTFTLTNGEQFEGMIISKRDNELLLNTGKRININDISSIN